jgi:hypothetical protein
MRIYRNQADIPTKKGVKTLKKTKHNVYEKINCIRQVMGALKGLRALFFHPHCVWFS